ncbi:MAG TPA: SPOR domain-containing protein [Gemmatimonadales bacterium]|nr:SPOR domain-containing protein [Gemmatimonadales bacterium]
MLPPRLLPLLTLAALCACRTQTPGGSSSQSAAAPSLRPQIGPPGRRAGFAIRVAANGGAAQLYRLPTLAPWPTPLRGKLPPVERVLGVDPEGAELFVRTAKREVLGLDLESGRVDTVATDVQRATLGPDGTVYAVDAKRRVTTWSRRVRLTWPHPLTSDPTDLFGASNERLVATVGGDQPALVIAAADQPQASRPLSSDGDVEASRWGDLVAVASDSGVTLLDPLGRREPGFVAIADHPRALLFSPSGHRVYVGSRSGLGLAVIDRYGLKEIDGVALPTPAAALRLDPFGQWLLARPSVGDTVWVVDLPIKQLVGGLPTPWLVDLPTVAPDGSLLVRRGNDVVAVRPDSLLETGRVSDGASDLWVATSWAPRGAAAGAAAGTAAAADSAGAEGPLYVQVSVSRNQTWSQQMADELIRAGLPAKVLAPVSADEGYRVVLGPYPTRDQAEVIGRKLGRPYWIYRPGQ